MILAIQKPNRKIETIIGLPYKCMAFGQAMIIAAIACTVTLKKQMGTFDLSW